MMSVYRDEMEAARLVRDERVAEHEAARAPAVEAQRVRGLRLARIASGAVLVAAAVTFWVLAVLPLPGALALDHIAQPTRVDDGTLVLMLPGAWLAAVLVYAACRLALRRRERALAAPFTAGDDPHKDLARLAAAASPDALRAAADRLETASVALPLAGWSLLAPITSHFLVGATAGAGFANWIRLTAVITGLAHVAAVIVAVLFARRVRREPGTSLAGVRWWSMWAVLAATAGSLVPYGIFILPPLVVAATGLAVGPAGYTLMRRRIERERRALAVPT